MPPIRTRCALLAAALAALTACSRPQSSVPAGFARYGAPENRFSCQVPSDWRVREDSDPPTVVFYGPAQAPRSYSIALSISYRENISAANYYSGQLASGAQVQPLINTNWKDQPAYEFSAERRGPMPHGPPLDLAEKTVIIPARTAILAITASSPPAQRAQAESALENLLQSLSIPGH